MQIGAAKCPTQLQKFRIFPQDLFEKAAGWSGLHSPRNVFHFFFFLSMYFVHQVIYSLEVSVHVTNFSLFIGRLEYIWYRENKNEDFDSMTHKKNFDTSKCCHGARKQTFRHVPHLHRNSQCMHQQSLKVPNKRFLQSKRDDFEQIKLNQLI